MFAVKQPTTKVLPLYQEFHPRWYRPRVSVYWWLGQWQYLKFILREISSVFVAVFVVITLLQLRSEEHTSELQSRENLVCRLLLEKKKQNESMSTHHLTNKSVNLYLDQSSKW